MNINKNENKINLRNHEFVRKKQNDGWKLSDTDWFHFSFYNPSCFFLWSELIRVQFYFIFIFYSIRVSPSRSELIRPGLAVLVDPVRLLYLPKEINPRLFSKIGHSIIFFMPYRPGKCVLRYSRTKKRQKSTILIFYQFQRWFWSKISYFFIFLFFQAI